MKDLTQNIQTEIRRQDFIDALKNLPNWTTNNGWGNIIPQNDGVSIEEQIVRLSEIISFLKRNSKLLDGLTWTKRSQIFSHLSQYIIPWAIQVVNGQQGQGILKNRSDYIDTLYELLSSYLIVEKKSDRILEEKIDFNEIKVSYQESITKLEQILKHKDVIDKFIGAKDIVTIIEELKNQAQSKKDEIDKVGDILDAYEITYNNTTNSLTKAEESLTNLNAQNIKLQKESSEILKNSSDILNNATSGAASKEFKDMANNINLDRRYKYISRTGGLCVFVLIWVFGGLSITVFGKTFGLAGLEKLSGSDIGNLILRLGFILPFFALELFFYKQLEFYKKLKEEYLFKATVSGTLQNYVSILRTNEERQGMQDYIMELTKDILKSPIPNNEDGLDKKGKELLGKVFDKSISFAERKINGTGE